jgi:hypothetical protein
MLISSYRVPLPPFPLKTGSTPPLGCVARHVVAQRGQHAKASIFAFGHDPPADVLLFSYRGGGRSCPSEQPWWQQWEYDRTSCCCCCGCCGCYDGGAASEREWQRFSDAGRRRAGDSDHYHHHDDHHHHQQQHRRGQCGVGLASCQARPAAFGGLGGGGRDQGGEQQGQVCVGRGCEREGGREGTEGRERGVWTCVSLLQDDLVCVVDLVSSLGVI